MHIPLLSSLLLSPLDALHSLSHQLVYALFASTPFVSQPMTGEYLLGLGIADITGPVVETNMMGYASLAQTATGLHMRQRARAFIVAEVASPADRILFINADIAMGDSGVRRALLAALAEEYGEGTYHAGNVALVGTHQHSGVGGYLENLLPQITSRGLHPQTLSAILSGTLLATRRAHASLAPGSLALGTGRVENGSINRSPTAYRANPAAERARYSDAGGEDGDQEWGVGVLRFGGAAEDEAERGFLSFFGVHGTSIYENNTLISGDNKGMAAYLYESSIEPHAMPGNTTYVAGFVQGAVGDTSPNTLGAFCESPGQPYDGLPCVANSSTCGGRAQECHGRGPLFDKDLAGSGELGGWGFESNTEVGRRQVAGVRGAMGFSGSASASSDSGLQQGPTAKTELKAKVKRQGGKGGMQPVHGPVRSAHAYVDMSGYEFSLANGTRVRTCPAAMGFSFAGGTTDGPGAFDFVQGDNKTEGEQNPFWELVKVFITPPPSKEQAACQAPKPILLNTGFAHRPYEWAPSTVDVQMFRVGNFVMVIVPGEPTTMAGRRLRETIHARLVSSGIFGDQDDETHVVIVGTANTYAHYVTTREEYAVQRYEGASTLFGPHTLEAYIDKYTSMVPFLANGVQGPGWERPQPPSDAPPKEQISKAISMQTDVKFDAAPFRKQFGQAVEDVRSEPYRAGETVWARFVGANPRNNLRLEGTFIAVERLDAAGTWVMVKSDSHPSTVYRWKRESTILGTSSVRISWTIESNTPAGIYRLRYFGDSKSLGGKISAFVGTSGNFTVG
ncbi:ceramidase [Mycena albidolilacea]|uniref:Neutral ceramidase n=1 Tax=Mycena albidolilacea TaxID=1033008 RepID=A0AAD7A8A4_9AGAR|nr:ceramidase [Mycena albidolilacea]